MFEEFMEPRLVPSWFFALTGGGFFLFLLVAMFWFTVIKSDRVSQKKSKDLN